MGLSKDFLFLVLFAIAANASAQTEPEISGRLAIGVHDFSAIEFSPETVAKVRERIIDLQNIHWEEAAAAPVGIAQEKMLANPASQVNAKAYDLGNGNALPAYALADPEELAIAPGVTPRNCQDVRLEFRRVRAWAWQIDSIRRQVERELDQFEWYLRNYPHADLRGLNSQIDADLAQISFILHSLQDFQLREARAVPDREWRYQFRIMGPRSWRPLANGFTPVESVNILAFQLSSGDWIPMQNNSLASLPGFHEVPGAVDGQLWELIRPMKASEACIGDNSFALDVESAWQAFSKNESPTKDALGKIKLDPRRPVKSVHVILYSDTAPWIIWD